MAKKPQKLDPLTFAEIVLRGDTETIRQALEARSKIDELLAEREEAYRKIAELETQVEDIVGEEGVFPFPEPPAPVSAFPAPAKKAAKKATKPKAEPKPAEEKPEADTDADDSDEEENED